jgi:hypothetical protein
MDFSKNNKINIHFEHYFGRDFNSNEMFEYGFFDFFEDDLFETFNYTPKRILCQDLNYNFEESFGVHPENEIDAKYEEFLECSTNDINLMFEAIPEEVLEDVVEQEEPIKESEIPHIEKLEVAEIPDAEVAKISTPKPIENQIEKKEKVVVVVKENSYNDEDIFNHVDMVEESVRGDIEDINGILEQIQSRVQETDSKQDKLLQKMKVELENMRKLFFNKLQFISSNSGGGEVRILRMDDIDTSNIGDGKSVIWDSSVGKFVFVDPASVSGVANAVDKYTITAQNLVDGFLDLTTSADLTKSEQTELQMNGSSQSYPECYTYTNDSRIDISGMDLTEGDFVRIVYPIPQD